MIDRGVDVNKVTDHGESALSQAVRGNNVAFAELLLKHEAKIFYEEEKYRDNSPFFQAISLSSIWAIEMFCDHGADVNTTSAAGQSPLIYAAVNNFDEIAMYLSLRCEDNNQEDGFTGLNVLALYLLREDTIRCQ